MTIEERLSYTYDHKKFNIMKFNDDFTYMVEGYAK
jgi:hypothetical protein